MDPKRFISQNGYFNLKNIPDELKPVEQEIRLMRKVLDRALLDLFEECARKEEDAHNWFFSKRDEEDFYLICNLANYDPKKVRKKVKIIVDSGVL